MSGALKQIVDAYVTLGNTKALEDLKAHREKLLSGVKDKTDFNYGFLLGQINEEIALIDAGLKKMQ
jgi:hypothetical protein